MSDFEPLKTGAVELRNVDETLAAWRESDQQAHIVQFCEDDSFLVSEVSRLVGTAIGAGDCAVIIATKAHREAIAHRLATNGLNTAVAIRQGRFVSLDAAETLAKFMSAGEPDPEQFTAVIGDVFVRAKKATGRENARLAAFGEMVALLWAEGKKEAAIRLEQLWNSLAETHTFALHCAYPIKGFSRSDSSELFSEICAEHTSVLPTESYMTLINEEERRRAVAHLQQKAKATETDAALRQSEERFRLLVEGVQDYAIYSMDPNGVVTSWNVGARRIKGYIAEEIIGQNFSRFYTPEDLKQGFPAVCFRRRERKAIIKARVGASGKMARDSGPT
jgi:PAS domain-containing protein